MDDIRQVSLEDPARLLLGVTFDAQPSPLVSSEWVSHFRFSDSRPAFRLPRSLCSQASQAFGRHSDAASKLIEFDGFRAVPHVVPVAGDLRVAGDDAADRVYASRLI